MKKLLTALVLFAATLGFANAQTLPKTLTTGELMRMPANSIGIQTPKAITQMKQKAYDKMLASSNTFRNVVSGEVGYYNFGNSEQSPVVYEPKSGALIVVLRSVLKHEGGADTDPGDGVIYIKTSMDKGLTWSQSKVIFREQNSYPVYPSIAVFNPTNSSNPDNFNYIVFAGLYKASGPNIPLVGGMLIILTPGEDPSSTLIAGPDDNNGEGELWLSANMLSVDAPDGKFAYFWGGLIPPDETRNSGYYGFGAYGVDDGSLINAIPQTWGIDNFRKEADQTKGHYNNIMEVKADKNGILYAAVANMFPASVAPFDPNYRTLAIAKSSNHGKTWTAWDKMDSTKLRAFVDEVIASQPGNELGNWFIIPYKGDAFEVTGTDEYSYFTRIVINPSKDKSTLFDSRVFVVEISRKDGVWNVAPVSETSIYSIQAIADEKLHKDGDETGDFLEVNDMDSQLETALSADGSQIIVKYVDNINKYSVFPAPISFNRRDLSTKDDAWDYNTYPLDSIGTTDVFMNWRAVNGGQWLQESKNVSNDFNFEKATRMPSIVPSKDEILMFTVDTKEDAPDFTNPSAKLFERRHNYTSVLKQMIEGEPQIFNLAVFKFDDGYQRPENSVVESAPGFSLAAPYPNPVSADEAHIRLNLTNSGNVTFRMTNSIGEVVAERTIFQNAGQYDIPVPVNALANGAYFYTVTVGDHTISQILNVIR